MDSKLKHKLVFVTTSIVGILLFMIPIFVDKKWTIAVKVLADLISSSVGAYLPALCTGIITASAALALIAVGKPRFIMDRPLLKDCFSGPLVWVAVRSLGCVFVWLTYLELASPDKNSPLTMIAGAEQGGVALELVSGLVIIFAIASFLLPLLLDFGLLEFIGALLTKYMRPIFTVPGRAAVDCITSWIGDGTLGVMLTCNQYEGGYYSAREAAVISTTFSAVSITFSLVVLSQVGLLEYFGVYYLIICLVGVICAIICPRIPPLSWKKDDYLIAGRAMEEKLPDGYTNSVDYGLALAVKRVAEHQGVGEFLSNGLKNCFGMWFCVLPTVMCIGTIALIVANYTPIFQYLGLPFLPLLNLLQVPDAQAASATMIVGFTDMFTPSVIISSANVPDLTRFIVAVISVTQVLFLDEVGGLILSSKLPINLWELFVIFLERTVISILVVCPLAHLLF